VLHSVFAAAKPSPEIFERIIDLEQVLADDVYFIDDNERNVEVAKNIGMSAHLFISAEKLKKALSQVFL